MPVKVSVVIPAYNTAQYIADALDSVEAQTFRDFETIVVNDGSADTPELEAVLAPYHDRITYIRKNNAGVASARNAGIAVARGSLIAFLDSDDIWDPAFLQVLVGIFEKHNDVDVVYSNSRMFSHSGEWDETGMDVYPTDEEVTFEAIVLQRVWVFCCCLVRAETLRKVGSFDPNLRYAEDLDLWLRIAHGGGKFRHTRQPLLHYRRRPDSLCTDYQHNDRAMRALVAVYEGLSNKLTLTDSEKLAVDRAIKRAKSEVTGLKPIVRKVKGRIRAILASAFGERLLQTVRRRSTADPNRR